MNVSTLIRIEKLHTLDQVAAADAHNSRRNAPGHANPSGQIVVLRGAGATAQGLLTRRLHEARIRIPLRKHGLTRKRKERHQRIIGLNVLCAVGERFFRRVRPESWAKRTLEYLDGVFGAANVLVVALHLDERVPHLHAIAVPITPQGKLSAAQIFNQDKASEPEDLSGIRRGNGTTPFFRRLQREFFRVCQEFDLDLTEPVPGGVMTHAAVSDWRTWIARAHQDIPKLPPFVAPAPSADDLQAPQSYAQRLGDFYQQIAQDTLSTIHAKAVERDELYAANQHMQQTLRQLGKENEVLRHHVVELEALFRLLQRRQQDVTLAELGKSLGIPIESIGGKPHILIPNGESIPVEESPKLKPYELPDLLRPPALSGLPALLGHSERDFIAALRALISSEQIERLVSYRDRHDFQVELRNAAATDLARLVKSEAFSSSSRQALALALHTHFGIAESGLSPGADLPAGVELATNRWGHLVLLHRDKAHIDGVAVNGSIPSTATGSPFEQYLGIFQEEPIIIGPVNAVRTVVVSNVIEALSLLSVPGVAFAIRAVVSGVAQLEKVAARALDRPLPVVLLEYGSGRRCGRHRKLRELLESGRGAAIPKLCPSDLRTGKPTFETIALDVEKDPTLGQKLAKLLGLASNSSSAKPLPKPAADSLGSNSTSPSGGPNDPSFG